MDAGLREPPDRIVQDGVLALSRLGEALQTAEFRFVTATPATHARVNARPENHEAKDLAGVFGWSRPFRRETVSTEIFDLMQKAAILRREGDLWRSSLRVSSLFGELFFHSAYPTTEPDSVFFGPDTYRFANAVEAGLGRLSTLVRRAIDVGCGAGPGGLLVAKTCPHAEVVMVDINEGALALTRVNAALAGLGNVFARRSNLFANVEGTFDLIVSNPPYLNDPLARAYRHGGGEFGAALSLAILDASLARLAPGGTLILYTGVAIVDGCDPFLAAARRQLDGSAFVVGYREVDPDVFGEELETPGYRRADRIAAVVLTVTRSSRTS